jgi:hypothetical protein
MSDAALSGPAAALENSAASNAMKAADCEAGRRCRANVGSADPAAGMETSDVRKTRGGRRADVDPGGPAKPMQTAAPRKA